MRIVCLLAAIVAVASGVCGAAEPSWTTLIPPDSRVLCAALTPDGATLVAVVGPDRTLRMWDLATRLPRDWEIKFQGYWSGHLLFLTPDGKRLITGGHNDQVQLWDLAD